MEVSRRGLFKFGAAAVLSAAIAPVVVAEPAPILWGDGEHDDTVALQALLDGKPVRVAGEDIIASSGRLDGGFYLVSAPLRFRRDDIHVHNIRLLCDHNDYILWFEGGVSGVVINQIHMQRTPRFDERHLFRVDEQFPLVTEFDLAA